MADYINNKIFYQQLKEYKETNSKKIYNEIGKSFILISKNLLNRSNFINYTPDRKDEMISDAVYYMCRYIDKYDLEKTNPFAYFTMIARNAFLQNINNYSKMDEMFSSIEYIENMDSKENII